MPNFLTRSFSAKRKKKDSVKHSDTPGTPVSPSISSFRVLSSKGAPRPASSPTMADGGTTSVNDLLSRTPAAPRMVSRSGENGPNTIKPPSPASGATGKNLVDRGGYSVPSAENGKASQSLVQGRVQPPHRVNSPRYGPPQTNQSLYPLQSSPQPQQDYFQQLRRSTASPSLPFRAPSRGPSSNGPYPSLQTHHHNLASFNALHDAENFNIVDFYNNQGRNPSRNSNRNYHRSHSMTSEPGGNYQTEPRGSFGDMGPPSPRTLKPHPPGFSEQGSQNMRCNSPNIATARGNRRSDGMGLGMDPTRLDRGLSSKMGPTHMAHNSGRGIPPMPQIPNRYKPPTQTARNQNQLINPNYSQYSPVFPNGRRRGPEAEARDGRYMEGPTQYPTNRELPPPRVQSPSHFHGPHPAFGGRLDSTQSPHSREFWGRVSTNTNGPDMVLSRAQGGVIPTDCFPIGAKPDQELPIIPTALPTPSLTPTPPSRSNSNERQKDQENMPEAVKVPNRDPTVDSRQYQHWPDNGLPQGLQNTSQRSHDSNAPPSPVSVPTTPVTVSSASSVHGNSVNNIIAQRIHVAAPIMPGPVKENCYTKDISLVMEECMMGHGKAGKDSVMKRTGNWQHQVGCMLCGCPGGESHEAEPLAVGNHWLWLCSWCALRICTECRMRLSEEEENLKDTECHAGTVKVNLRALRSKIIKEKRQDIPQKPYNHNAPPSPIGKLRLDRVASPDREHMEALEPKTPLAEDKLDMPKGDENIKTLDAKVAGESSPVASVKEDNVQMPTAFITPHSMSPVQTVLDINRPTLPAHTHSEESVNSFATADSRVDAEKWDLSVKAETKIQKPSERTQYPPRISSRKPVTGSGFEVTIPKSEQLEEKEFQNIDTTPMSLPIGRATKNSIVVSPPVTITPSSPYSTPQQTLPDNTTAASATLQAVIGGSPNSGTQAPSSATFVPPPRNDSSLRSLVSPEMLALITGTPIVEYKPTAPKPSTPSSAPPPASSMATLFSPLLSNPAIPPQRILTKSPPPIIPLSPSPPPKSKSPSLVQARPLISTPSLSPSPPPQKPSPKRYNETRSSSNTPPAVDNFVLPPLSFESQIAQEIDNVFGARVDHAPKPQATHTEEAYTQAISVESPPRGKRWYKGLFSGRK